MKNIALHILDLAENSARAKARKVTVSVREEPAGNRYLLVIEDDGSGMSEEVLSKASDPFYTSRKTRKVGLGLSLIQQNAERTGGTFAISSEPGTGTRLEARFVMNHPDRLPLGEIDDVLVLLATGWQQLHLVYNHETEHGSYRFDTEEIRGIVGSMEAINMETRKFIREMIRENLNDIQAEP
jgi:anti-sigma regulatory factor (Ser/Thr protein kinase)